MSPTVDDLRVALHQEASTTALPSPEALVNGAAARVRSARRRRAAAGAAAAVVLVAAGVVATVQQGRHSSQPAHTGPFRVVRSGGDFPAYSGGGKRLLVVSAPAAKAIKGTVDVPTTPGRTLVLLPVCTPPAVFEFNRNRTFTATPGQGAPRPLGCMPDPHVNGGGVELGPATGQHTSVAIDIPALDAKSGSLASATGATVTLGFYEEVPWADYRLPSRPADWDTNPDRAWPRPTDKNTLVLGPTTAAEANTARSVVVPASAAAKGLTLEARGPGRLRMTVNGRPVTQGISFGPRVEDGWLEFFDYTFNSVGLDPSQYSPAGSGGSLRIEVTPDGFAGPDWRVVVGRQD